jgi:hypothetical protein
MLTGFVCASEDLEEFLAHSDWLVGMANAFLCRVSIFDMPWYLQLTGVPAGPICSSENIFLTQNLLMISSVSKSMSKFVT